ncbi:hypothetical protein C8R47DRAFT_1312802 [Mycena vitilis]|nr:hypothetical protein C8R47DRAFT_1312802 [Mycena vitilis]
MFSTLSTELVQEIGMKLTKSDQKYLRAACKDIGLAINPLFFSSLVLRTKNLSLDTGINNLTALASGKTGWSQYTKSLSILPGPWQNHEADEAPERPHISDNAMRGLVASALTSLKNIRAVVCSINGSDAEWKWLRDPVLSLIAGATLLEDLELSVHGYNVDPDLVLPRLSSSSLRRMKITTPYWMSVPLVDQVPQIVEQNRGLTSLHVSGRAATAWSETWAVLRKMGDGHLKEINAAYCPELLTYIDSYSGLERLEIINPDAGNPDAFFQTILPRHAATLVVLSCSAGYECAWSFNPNIVDSILQLQRLTHLAVSINKADIVEGTDNVVVLLLRTVAALPSLEGLVIRAAGSPRNRGAKCGNPAMAHRSAVARAVITTIQGFRGDTASRAVLSVGLNRFHLKPADELQTGEEPGGWVYHQTKVARLSYWG